MNDFDPNNMSRVAKNKKKKIDLVIKIVYNSIKVD